MLRDNSPIDVLPDILMDLPDPVFAFTTDLRYLFINTAAAEFLNALPIDVVGRRWQELGYSPAVMQPLSDKIESVVATGRPARYRLSGTALKDLREFDLSLTPLWSDEQRMLAVLVIAHDISEFSRPALLD